MHRQGSRERFKQGEWANCIQDIVQCSQPIYRPLPVLACYIHCWGLIKSVYVALNPFVSPFFLTGLLHVVVENLDERSTPLCTCAERNNYRRRTCQNFKDSENPVLQSNIDTIHFPVSINYWRLTTERDEVRQCCTQCCTQLPLDQRSYNTINWSEESYHYRWLKGSLV